MDFCEIHRVLRPFLVSVIVCLETAADLMLWSSGNLYVEKFRVYATESIESTVIETVVLSPAAFALKETIDVDGMRCTSHMQTILDLLEYESDVSIQTLTEVLGDYYSENGDSFANLSSLLSEKQLVAFEKWRQDAIDCSMEG